MMGNRAKPSGEPLTPVQRRLIQATSLDEARELLFQHTVFCQTCLPYRDPGDIPEWERVNGKARLKIIAGEAMHPVRGEFVRVGLPFGPKPRLVMVHLKLRHYGRARR